MHMPINTKNVELDFIVDRLLSVRENINTEQKMDRVKMGFQIRAIPTEHRRIHVFEALPMKHKRFTRN